MNRRKTVLGGLCLVLLLVVGCQHHRPGGLSPDCLAKVAPESRQAVVVAGDDVSPSAASVQLYERVENSWQRVVGPLAATVGRNGLAPVGEKREGDGRTPSGVYVLGRAFGYEPLQVKMPYIVLTPEMIWVDDPRSPLYNRLVEKQAVGEGVSREIMKRGDHLYKYGIVIEYNTMPVVAGAGSAIFFHIWRDAQTTTAGCVALAEADLLGLLRRLDPMEQPVAVIGDVCPP